MAEWVRINALTILLALFDKYKNKSWVLSASQIEERKNSFFGGIWKRPPFLPSHHLSVLFENEEHVVGLKSGIALGKTNHLWFKSSKKIVAWEVNLEKFATRRTDISDRLEIRGRTLIYRNTKHQQQELMMTVSEPEANFMKEFIEEASREVLRERERLELKEKKKEEREKNEVKKEKERQKLLRISKDSFYNEYDKDGNGVIDVIESDDFMKLFKKHQQQIIELDKGYVQQFVKISHYLDAKRKNIQSVFAAIKEVETETQLQKGVDVLNNQIHTFEVLLFHSLTMITSAVTQDLIAFYEIYEAFDKLNVFNSNWENEVADKLTNIGDGLDGLMSAIGSMERAIVDELSLLSYVTESGLSELGDTVAGELQSIGSAISVSNLMMSVQVAQQRKIIKNTNSLKG